MSLCTMFAFEGVEDPNLLHCTHKYFPADAGVSRGQLISVLEAHFKAQPFKPFDAHFSELVENFGSDGTYRVVMPRQPDDFHLELKAKLDELHPDKFPEYLPHVTVGRNTDSLAGRIRDYVLMDDHKLVWSASKDGKMARFRLSAKDLEEETRKDFGGKGEEPAPKEKEASESSPINKSEGGAEDGIPAGVMKTVHELDGELDQAGIIPEPHRLTPEEMKQNPLALLDPDEFEDDLANQQKRLDDTWAVAEAGGKGDSSLNDNDSTNGPVPLTPGQPSDRTPPKESGKSDLPPLPPLQKK